MGARDRTGGGRRQVAQQSRLLVADVHLKDSGCSFDEQIRLIRGETTYEAFKAECEARFDQRLQLSYEKSAPAKELNFAAALCETCPDLAGILHKTKAPTRVTQVALTAKSWQTFVASADANHRLKVKAWAVYSGVSLKAGNAVSSRQEIISQLEKGTEGMPQDKRLPALRRKLDGMCSEQLQSLHSQTLGEGHTLNLFRTMSESSRDKTVERLWEYSRGRNARRMEEEMLEDDRVKQRLRLPPRRTTPSAQEEACADRLYHEPFEKKKQTLEELDMKYAALAPQVKSTQIPDDAVTDLVTRLYGTREDNTRKLEETRTKIYGACPPPKKLDKAAMEQRLDSLYTKAIARKVQSIEKLAEANSSPKASPAKLSKKGKQDLLERLTSPK